MGLGSALLFNKSYDTFFNFDFLGSRGMLNVPWGGILVRLMGMRGVNPESFK